MTEHTPLTRREFLGDSLAVVSTAATIPAFLHHSALALAEDGPTATLRSRPGIPEDRILVVVQLSGGNDGLNTVVPYGHDAYHRARPRIAVPTGEVLRLDDGQGVGLHPRMTAMKGMFDDGLACVVQGVGYPNPNRSHFASMDIWHTGDTLGGKGRGWIGKTMDVVAPEEDGAVIVVGREAPMATYGARSRPVSFEKPNLFRWSGDELHDLLAETYQTINRDTQVTAAAPGNQAAFVRRTAMNAQVASDRIRRAVAQRPQTNFPGGQLANQMRMVAAMIGAGLQTRVYYVGLGGFDTHANQQGRHQNILGQFSDSVAAFYRELAAIGQAGRVLTMAFSEFGRRAAENASRGTDHGAAGPMFLFGPMVKAGLVGKHPDLDRLDPRGDVAHQVDFRSVYAAVLDKWLRTDSRRVLGKPFKAAPVLDGVVGNT